MATTPPLATRKSYTDVPIYQKTLINNSIILCWLDSPFNPPCIRDREKKALCPGRKSADTCSSPRKGREDLFYINMIASSLPRWQALPMASDRAWQNLLLMENLIGETRTGLLFGPDMLIRVASVSKSPAEARVPLRPAPRGPAARKSLRGGVYFAAMA